MCSTEYCTNKEWRPKTLLHHNDRLAYLEGDTDDYDKSTINTKTEVNLLWKHGYHSVLTDINVACV